MEEENEFDFEFRKLKCTIPKFLMDKLYQRGDLRNIDTLVTQLLIQYLREKEQ